MKRKLILALIVTMVVVLSVGTVAPARSQGATVAREDTVIFDIDSVTIADPFNQNWFNSNIAKNQGAHQSMWEPLFILNYETGKIQPWLATDFKANSTQDVWTLSLRDGVTWSDSQPFTADAVVFPIQTLLDDKT